MIRGGFTKKSVLKCSYKGILLEKGDDKGGVRVVANGTGGSRKKESRTL